VLLIKQDTTNNLYFNVLAYGFDYTNYILLVLTNDMTKKQYAVILYGTNTLTPLSYVPLIEIKYPNNLASEIRLKDTGYYKYQLYEQSSGTNLNKNDASVIKPLNFGKAFVSGAGEVVYTEHEDTTDTTNYMYIK
tara:strand:+ start:346 stop:750 length:405 start_codon:yes stop_codon:yes gene_type:complete